MIYAFVPLMVTGILFLLIGLREKVPEGSFIFPLELSAITLSVGSASKGAIEIYGTDSRLLKWYYIAAGVMFAAAAVTIIYEIAHSRNN